MIYTYPRADIFIQSYAISANIHPTSIKKMNSVEGREGRRKRVSLI